MGSNPKELDPMCSSINYQPRKTLIRRFFSDHSIQTLRREGWLLKLPTMLLIGGNSSQKTHYDVLSVKEDASYDEIRASYKAAILNSHPDKVQSKPQTLNPQYTFLDVQKAWEVLSDSKSRANYDKKLQISRCDVSIAADEIKLEDMSIEDFDDSKEYFYQCRCGDYFSVSSIDLQNVGILLGENGGVTGLQSASETVPATILLPCGSCSLKIRLIIDVAC